MAPTADDRTQSPKETPRRRQHVGEVSRAAATYKRKKTATACQVCRARRTKCDNRRPCSYCQKNGHDCVSSSFDEPHWDPATMHILERLDGLQKQLDGVSGSMAAGKSRVDTSSPASGRSEALLHMLCDDSLYPQTLESVMRWAPLQQLNGARHMRQDAARANLPRKKHDPAVQQSPDLEYSTCRTLIDAFFAYVHPKNPILNEAEVRASLKQACFDGFRWDADHGSLLLILAIGTLAMPLVDERSHESQPDLNKAKALFEASQKRFASDQNATYLTQAKYHFYSGVYLMSVLRPFDAWRSFLQALASCQGFSSLAPRQSESPGFRDPDEESLYWSCWKSEREVRNELGLPDFGASGPEHPHMYPSLPDGCEGGTLRAWYFYLAEISLWRLETSAKNDVAKFVGSGRGVDLERLAALALQLREPLQSWHSSLPPTLSVDDIEHCQESCVLRFVLRGRLTYYHELLTWPFLHAALHLSESMTPQVQRLAIDGVKYHLDRLATNRPGFYHRHHGTWLMMRSSARSALITLAAASTPNILIHLPHSWVAVVLETVEMLEYWNQQGGGLDQAATLLRCEMNRFMAIDLTSVDTFG